MPVIVDLSVRLETEKHVVIIDTMRTIRLRLVDAPARVRVLEFAVPFHHVGVLLEVRYADAEVVELIGELSGELVDHGLVSRGDVFLCHGLGDHLCHLIARDVLVALERRVAIALDHAVLRELCHSIICPVIRRNIAERIRRSKRRGSRADNERRRQCRNESLLHEKFLLHYTGSRRCTRQLPRTLAELLLFSAVPSLSSLERISHKYPCSLLRTSFHIGLSLF